MCSFCDWPGLRAKSNFHRNTEKIAEMSTLNKEQTRYEKTKSLVVTAYRKRWNDILVGKSKPQGAGVFEATTTHAQNAMAKSFYARRHLEKLVSLSDDAIVANHLPLIKHLATQSETPLRGSLVDRLLGGQYVLFAYDLDDMHTLGFGSEVNLDQDEIDPWKPDRYPGSVLYDDWYECVGGFRSNYLGVLMKSSGEPFSKSERQRIAETVCSNVVGNDQDELWSFGFHLAGKRKNQVVVSITNDANGYRESLEDTLRELDASKLRLIAADVEPLRMDEESPFINLIEPITPSLREASDKAILEILLSCVRNAPDAFALNGVERVIGAHFFGGRSYYHRYAESTDSVGSYGFFNQV
jgi:hypothetical protein